jgi:capsular exopolysaccharide synthesis family protein
MDSTSITLLTGLVGSVTALLTVTWSMFWSVAQERKSEGKAPPNFRTLMRGFKRQRVIILVTTLVGVASTPLVQTLEEPVFQSSVLIRLWQVEPADSVGSLYRRKPLSPQHVEGELQLLRSDTLQQLAIRGVVAARAERDKKAMPSFPDSLRGEAFRIHALRELQQRIRVEALGENTPFIRITANSSDPSEAAVMAAVYRDAYASLLHTVNADTVCSPSAPAPRATELVGCGHPLDKVRMEILDNAKPAIDAVTVPLHRTLPLGLFLGATVGFVFAGLRLMMDTRIWDAHQLLDKGYSVIAAIPRISDQNLESFEIGNRRNKRERNRHPGTLMLHHSFSTAGERYRALFNRLFAGNNLQNSPRTVVVTSARPGEGKTTTAMNLAATAANFGLRVALVDADLRRPSIHSALDLQKEPGLTQLILGHSRLEDVLVELPSVAWTRPRVIPSGTQPPNPAELLNSHRMTEVLEQLRDAFDIIILDSPPALVGADAEILAARTDACLFVVRTGISSADRVREATERLSSPVHIILNESEPGDTFYGSYSSFYA